MRADAQQYAARAGALPPRVIGTLEGSLAIAYEIRCCGMHNVMLYS